jgi:hypothetical protein
MLSNHDPQPMGIPYESRIFSFGITGVDDLFDALNPPSDPANDAGTPVSNDLTSPILGGYVHVAF